MRSYLKTFAIMALGACLMVAAGCSSSPLDNPGADVVLQVSALDAPPVTVQDENGVCLATIQPWSVEFINVPKSEGAITSPYNDITVRSMTASYTWQDVVVGGPISTTLALIGAPATVPADSTQDVNFFPLLAQHFNATMLSTTANMFVTVDAVTATGDQVGVSFTGQLFVEGCTGGGP
jgi:hypothetical protein